MAAQLPKGDAAIQERRMNGLRPGLGVRPQKRQLEVRSGGIRAGLNLRDKAWTRISHDRLADEEAEQTDDDRNSHHLKRTAKPGTVSLSFLAHRAYSRFPSPFGRRGASATYIDP